MEIKGQVWKFGDNINTDYIIPGKYLELTKPEEMAEHAMEGVDPEFPHKMEKGDVIVGGENFGCGSSREHAPLALKYAGVSCVLSKSFARIFYRNSINIGLPALECSNITDVVNQDDIIKVDLKKGIIKNMDSGETVTYKPLPGFMVEILELGGLTNYIKEKRGFLDAGI